MQPVNNPASMGLKGSGDIAEFSVTSWTLVGLAGLDDVVARQEVITRLLGKYLPPLRSHLVVRKRIDPHRADDLLQDFVADKILAAGIMQKAVRDKGKFRTFLLVALDRFVLNQIRDERAAKRSPTDGFAAVSVEDVLNVAGPDAGVNRAFDIDWARMILQQTLDVMRQTCIKAGRQSLWEMFEDRVVGPTLYGKTPSPYGQLAAKFSFGSPTEAGNAVLTARRMFVRLLRDSIAEYASNESEIDEELSDLRKILSADGV